MDLTDICRVLWVFIREPKKGLATIHKTINIKKYIKVSRFSGKNLGAAAPHFFMI
jgi:hypothetical protein